MEPHYIFSFLNILILIVVLWLNIQCNNNRIKPNTFRTIVILLYSFTVGVAIYMNLFHIVLMAIILLSLLYIASFLIKIIVCFIKILIK